MTTELCASCSEPLLLEVEPDSDVEESKITNRTDSVPDDVELSCGCHFHWECLLESYTITECPNCSKDVASRSPNGETRVLCNVKNEGGIQEKYDILPSAKEEAYLRTFPEERTGYAFLTFCRDGDIDAIVHLLRDTEKDDAEEEDDKVDLLRYTGSFEGIDGTGLHVAISNQQQHVAWLMLVLGSNLAWEKIPKEIMQGMDTYGLSKHDTKAGPDIRTIKDSEGRSPLDVAQEMKGEWTAWIKNDWLDAPA